MSLNIEALRQTEPTILVVGNHPQIIQSILDFDFLSHKNKPSVVGIVSAGTKFQKYFWGQADVLIPCFSSLPHARATIDSVDWMLNLNSGRRAFTTTSQFFEAFPQGQGGHLFAEDIPEEFALQLYNNFQKHGKTLIGTAGVGMLVPAHLKLGAIGGTDWHQLVKNNLTAAGNVAVLSASGGMVNEIITMVANTHHPLSFALCFGGDRFPITTPEEAFLIAQNDPQTEHIVYYGELGGYDEYQLADLLKSKKVTKPVVAYIAGIIGESFDQPVQFGHAKALARMPSETASAKKDALRRSGVKVADSIEELQSLIAAISAKSQKPTQPPINLDGRRRSLFTSTISQETPAGYAFVGNTLDEWADQGDFVSQIVAGLLGHQPKSKNLVKVANQIFLLTIDHGPQVSGALNTIITARAGKNMIDSLAAGLLTIGPRFGGAVNDAAQVWYNGVIQNLDPSEYVEKRAKMRQLIPGIGHKKYRIGLPDPRTARLQQFADKLKKHPYLDFAHEVEKITSAKKGNLILNVDGFIAALLLDILEQEENLNHDQLNELIDIEFFNAFFVIPRTIGLISHHLDQKRLDEGLFRLPDDNILLATES